MLTETLTNLITNGWESWQTTEFYGWIVGWWRFSIQKIVFWVTNFEFGRQYAKITVYLNSSYFSKKKECFYLKFWVRWLFWLANNYKRACLLIVEGLFNPKISKFCLTNEWLKIKKIFKMRRGLLMRGRRKWFWLLFPATVNIFKI